jgi:hypothetical protein
MKPKKFSTIFENILRKSIKDRILKESENSHEVHHIMCDGKPVETFNTHDEAMDNLGKYEKKFPGKHFIIEKGNYESYDDMLETFDNMTEVDEEMNEREEEECTECGEMNESKKVMKIKESDLLGIINQIIEEDVPGADMLKKTRQGTAKETTDHLKDVNKKITDYLSFENNDNPEFPKPIGKGDKKVIHNTDEENEEMEDNRGYGLQHLKYDIEPSKEFKERLEKAIKGDSTMGNSTEYGNAIKSDLGDNVLKQAKRKKEKEDGRPLYPKDPQPVKLVRDKKTVSEEIERMKEMYTYYKKTQ